MPTGDLFRKTMSPPESSRYLPDGTPKRYYGLVEGDNVPIHATLLVQPVVMRTNVALCDSWDPEEQTFDASRPITVATRQNSPSQPNIDDFTIEYLPASAPASTLGAACGTLGDSTGWVTDLASIPGGASAVRAVRISSPSVRLNDGLRVQVPFVTKSTKEYDALLASRNRVRDETETTPRFEDVARAAIGTREWGWGRSRRIPAGSLAAAGNACFFVVHQ